MTDAKSEEPVDFRGYVVTLIDLLGQQSAFVKWELLPTNPQESDEFIQGIQRSFGHVMFCRGRFLERFNQWKEGCQELPDSVFASTPDRGELVRKFQAFEIHFMQFSDTIVVYSPLENEHGHYNLLGMCGMLVATGTVLLEAFNNGVAFRAAIEIGMAGCFGVGDLYGPALARVHYLESTVAQHPRIVIGDMLPQYLQACRVNPGNSPGTRTNRRTAQLCLELLKRDQDGQMIVDYLGKAFGNLSTNPENHDKLRTGASQFVLRELDRFRVDGNATLIERYEKLAAYFERSKQSG